MSRPVQQARWRWSATSGKINKRLGITGLAALTSFRTPMWKVTMRTLSPAGVVFKSAVAGGNATIAVSEGLLFRAFRSFTQPTPLTPGRF